MHFIMFAIRAKKRGYCWHSRQCRGRAVKQTRTTWVAMVVPRLIPVMIINREADQLYHGHGQYANHCKSIIAIMCHMTSNNTDQCSVIYGSIILQFHTIAPKTMKNDDFTGINHYHQQYWLYKSLSWCPANRVGIFSIIVHHSPSNAHSPIA